MATLSEMRQSTRHRSIKIIAIEAAIAGIKTNMNYAGVGTTGKCPNLATVRNETHMGRDLCEGCSMQPARYFAFRAKSLAARQFRDGKQRSV